MRACHTPDRFTHFNNMQYDFWHHELSGDGHRNYDGLTSKSSEYTEMLANFDSY